MAHLPSTETMPTVRTDVIESDTRRIETFGTNYHNGEPIILRLGSTATTELITQVEDYIILKSDDIRDDFVEKSEQRRRMEDMARNFVESTVGIRPEAEVSWQRYHNNGVTGTYTDKHIYMTTQDYTDNEDLEFIREAAVLVHEFAHAARDNSHAVIHKSTQPLNRHSLVVSHFPTSMILPKYSKSYKKYILSTEGAFFEEAFAQETAARWVDSFTQVSAQYSGLACRDGDVMIPFRHTIFDRTEPQSAQTLFSFGRPAFASHALSLLSQASETDLYDLMIQMRKSATKASAKKQFIKAVNSVEPGLYQKLRNLQCTDNDFRAGVSHVDKSTSSGQNKRNTIKFNDKFRAHDRLLATIKSLVKD